MEANIYPIYNLFFSYIKNKYRKCILYLDRAEGGGKSHCYMWNTLFIKEKDH